MVFPASTHSYSEASEEASVPTSNIRQCFNLRGAAGNSRSTANAARGGNLTSDPSSRSAAGRGTVNSSAGRAAQAVAARGTVDDHDQARNTADNAVTTNPDCAVCHEGSDHNDLLDVFISQTYNSKGETATANTDGTCSAVSCHGGKTTPDWSSGSLSVNTQCKSCHSSGTGEFNGYYSGKHKKHAVDKGYDCTVCHNTGKLDGGHFSNLSSSGFELSPADTIGGGSTQVGSYSGGRCSSVQCHGSEDW